MDGHAVRDMECVPTHRLSARCVPLAFQVPVVNFAKHVAFKKVGATAPSTPGLSRHGVHGGRPDSVRH